MSVKFGGFSTIAANDVAAGEGAEARVLAEIDRLGLARNKRDLDEKGYTVIPPDKIGPPEFYLEIRDRLIAAIERKYEISADLEKGLSRSGLRNAINAGASALFLLHEHPIFEKAMMNEAVITLVTYLLGESCEFDSMTGMVKEASDEHLVMHADLAGTPNPFPPYEEVCNATWVLTDYSAENGATCFVDGSHLRRRAPTPEEAVDISLFKPIEAPAGSVIVWGGRTWHGAVPRTAPGLRVGIISYYNRWYIQTPAGQYPAPAVTQEMINRNPPRFRRLLGLDPMPLDGANGSAASGGYNLARASVSQFA